MNYKRLIFVFLAAVAIDMQAERVLADSSKVFDIDEVVIISQPKEVYRLRRQALSSSSLSSSVMQQLAASDLRDLSQYVPNLTMPRYGSRLSSAIYVRGIGSRVNSPAVGIYMDGIPVMSKAAFNLHNYQLSRVDVLRGPQGTLYGQNTEGGLVRLFSRDPLLYQGTDVRLGYAMHNQRLVEVSASQLLGSDIGLSVAGFYEAGDGFFRNAHTGERADAYDEAGGKLQLKARLGSRWTLALMGDYQYVDQAAFPYGRLDLASGRVEAPASTIVGNYRRNNLLTGLTLARSGEACDFSSVSSYQYLDDRMLMDQDYLPADYMNILQEQRQQAFTQELTLRSHRPVGGVWHWATGAFFSSQWLRTNGPVFFNEALTGPIAEAVKRQMTAAMPPAMADKVSLSVDMGAPGLYHTPQLNLGLFHESNLELTSRLTATLGLRYDYMLAKASYESSAFMAMTADVMGKVATYTLRSALDGQAKSHFNQLLPKIALSYKLSSEGSNLYAIVSKGYRAGGYNIQMFSDILQTELNDNRQQTMRGDYDVPHGSEDYERINETISYKPETSWNYEAGAHLNLFQGSMQLDLAAFFMQVRNQQLSVMAGNYGFGRMMVNAGKSHSCGLEAALRGQLLSGRLDYMVNYGFTHAVFDEYLDGEVSYEDKLVPYVPQHTLSATADYHLIFTRGLLRQFTFGANVTAQGKTCWDAANSYQQPFYAILGCHADADFEGLQLSFWARNLTDARYNTFAVDNAATGKTEYFAQQGNPFQCGVDVRIHF